MKRFLTILVLGLVAAPGTGHAAGAIAVDSSKANRYGYSYGFADRIGADSRALSECGPGCRVVVRFSGGCVAYAADMLPRGTAWGWGTEATESGSRQRALQECQARAGRHSRCAVRVATCDR